MEPVGAVWCWFAALNICRPGQYGADHQQCEYVINKSWVHFKVLWLKKREECSPILLVVENTFFLIQQFQFIDNNKKQKNKLNDDAILIVVD